MADINSILSSLNNINVKNTFSVFIPSLKREVKFKPLTTKQQQSFYGCIADTVPFNTRFIIATFNAIKENCTEPDVINQLNVIDRVVILLAFRKSTLGSDLLVIKDEVQYESTFESSLVAATTLTLPENKTITVKNVEVELHVPFIIDQYNIEKLLRENVNLNEVDSSTVLQQAVLSETCKIINNIKIINDDKTVDAMYSQLSYVDRLRLIENLPAEVMLEVQSFAKAVSNVSASLLTVPLSNGTTATIEITVDFFLSR